MDYKYAYVLEDGEIVKMLLIDDEMTHADFVNDVCDEFFDEDYNEVDEEDNGMLYSVSETEQVFLTHINTTVYEELFS